eukprot:gnl/TRDRNA2_/TRDRNA2_146259_c1_seq2.p1 gnl/TRDRNA2_/TRDRNA2_146259_c1~~gnl/TRDRNA2_/TRDRNA2_146259_c1_seq2.p1  ORF type:complete len:218 (-),score=58.33 gnl/TRDRNA2_/TRDRNA2_146259_c1_seq2:97-750(-)
MPLADVLAEVSKSVEAAQVDTSLFSKLRKACIEAKKSPEVLEALDSKSLADAFEFILRLCEARPSDRKHGAAALATLLEAKGGLGIFAKVGGKSRLGVWKLPVSGGKGDGIGSADFAAQLLAGGCAPDDLLSPPEEVLAASNFSRELLKKVGEDASFKASAVGQVLLSADLGEEDADKPKRQVIGATGGFDAKSTKVVQCEMVNGMPKASQAAGVKF